jgi:hypothetical protein
MTGELIYLAAKEHAHDLERLAAAVRTEQRRRPRFGRPFRRHRVD